MGCVLLIMYVSIKSTIDGDTLSGFFANKWSVLFILVEMWMCRLWSLAKCWLCGMVLHSATLNEHVAHGHGLNRPYISKYG